MSPHPNATVALVTCGATTLLAFALHRAGVALPPEAVGGIATAATAGALVLGRGIVQTARTSGLAGIWDVIMHGGHP